MTTTYQTFLFDLDGTLLDSVPMIVESLRFSLVSLVGAAPDERALISGVGTPLAEQLMVHAERMLGAPIEASLLKELVATYIAHNLSIHDERVRPFPECFEVVEALALAGCRLGIVTSKSRQTSLRGLALGRLEPFFEVLIASEDVVKHKPHAEPVEKALNALGVGREGAVFIGDSPHDVQAGRAAGVDTVGALWGPFEREVLETAQPTHLLHSLKALLPFAKVNERGR